MPKESGRIVKEEVKAINGIRLREGGLLAESSLLHVPFDPANLLV